MSMSRKDFVAIAAGIKREVDRLPEGSAQRKVAANVVHAMLPALQEANSNFRRAQFVEACGLKMGEL